MRIDAARTQFLSAELGLYGVAIATATPGVNADAKDALIDAVSLGLLDNVDLVFPVLYPRLGPDDAKYSLAHAAAYTHFSMELTEEILSYAKQPVAMVPGLSTQIYNSNSVNQYSTVPTEYVAAQLMALEEGKYAETYVLWVSSENGVPGGLTPFLAGLEPALADCLCGDLE